MVAESISFTPHPVTFFVVDDDEIDRETIVRGLRDLDLPNPIRCARDGVEALEILRGENGAERLAGPYLVLLDLNMPRMNGIEFLEEVRKDPKLHRAIVFVLTTSNASNDRLAAYDRHVAGYVLKARAGLDFQKVLNMLDRYWRYVEFPD